MPKKKKSRLSRALAATKAAAGKVQTAAGKVQTAATKLSKSNVGKTVSRIHSYTSLSELSRKAARAAMDAARKRKKPGKPTFAGPRLRF